MPELEALCTESVALNRRKEASMEIEKEPSVLLGKILRYIDEIRKHVTDVRVNRANFLMMAFCLVEMRPLLEDLLRQEERLTTYSISPALHRVSTAVQAIHSLTQRCSTSSKIILLYRCNEIVNEMIRLFDELGESLHFLLVESSDFPMDLQEQMADSEKKVKSASFFHEPSTGQLATEIASYIAEGSLEEPLATSLLWKIASHLNVPEEEAVGLKRELWKDIEAAETEGREKDVQELKTLYSILDPAQICEEKQQASAISPVHSDSIPPIPSSFFCPITRQVMIEPVMLVEEGYTYEREAILEWFDRGHRTCPDTGKELETLELVPNQQLQQAMVEFFDNRNNLLMAHALRQIRSQEHPAKVEEAINRVKKLMDSNLKLKRLLVSLDGIHPLIALLKPAAPQMKEKILRILCAVAALGDDYKISIIESKAVPILLNILQRNPRENGGPIQLLWELSKIEAGKKAILAEKGSIIIISSAFNSCTNDQKLQAEKLLYNLCQQENAAIIEAASSSVFGPIISHLVSGDDSTKLELARALSTSLELNESMSTSLVEGGVVHPLLNLLLQGSVECKQAVAAALRRLSCVDKNKVAIAKAGAIPVLVKFLECPSAELKIDLMVVLSALATDHQNSAEIDQEGAVSRLLEMIQSEDASLQEYSMKTLECMAKDSRIVRVSMMEIQLVPSIYRLLQRIGPSANCWGSILNFLCHFAEDPMSRPALVTTSEVLKTIIDLLGKVEEKEAIWGILSGLAKLDEMRPLLQSESHIMSISVESLKHTSPKIQENAVTILAELLDPTLVETSILTALARQGLISTLTDITMSPFSTEHAKLSAVSLLKTFSMHTPQLTVKQSFLKRFLAKIGMKRYKTCKVHAGKCSIKTTFCLVEAGSIPPLISLIKESSHHVAERALDTLYTLINNDVNNERGVDFLLKSDIISLASSLAGRNETTTEKAVKILERIYRIRKYRDQKYSNVAKATLCTTLSTGNAEARKAAATALMHLGMVPRDSTYSSTVSS